MKKFLFTVVIISCFAIPASCTISDIPFPAPKPEPGTVQHTEVNTDIIGMAEISESGARAWAAAHDASALFIDLAAYYWDYGKRTGIRPEVMYAQAALETAYGRFGGNVLPEMNNYAGIKRVGASGDATDDHESFAAPEDGVRAHYNHMSAYIGLAPVGIAHDRYYLVLSTDWAGTIKHISELGGKWCPDPEYGNKIINSFLTDMYNY